jgi:hypothetical protein
VCETTLCIRSLFSTHLLSFPCSHHLTSSMVWTWNSLCKEQGFESRDSNWHTTELFIQYCTANTCGDLKGKSVLIEVASSWTQILSIVGSSTLLLLLQERSYGLLAYCTHLRFAGQSSSLWCERASKRSRLRSRTSRVCCGAAGLVNSRRRATARTGASLTCRPASYSISEN